MNTELDGLIEGRLNSTTSQFYSFFLMSKRLWEGTVMTNFLFLLNIKVAMVPTKFKYK